MKKINLKLKFTDWIIIILAFYFSGTIIQNILAVKIIGNENLYLFDCGTLISPFVFASMDIITEILGKNKAIKYFTISTFLNIVFTLIFQLAVFLPASDQIINSQFSSIFSTNWRIVFASCVAFWVGNYINTFIMYQMKKKSNNKFGFIFRAIISTLFGQIVDNSLFYLIAFAPIGILNTYELSMNAILTNVLVTSGFEIIIESIFSPITNIAVGKLRKMNYEKN